MRQDLDSYNGLRAVQGWTPDQRDVSREQAVAQIARRQRTHSALVDLQTDTLGRIATMAGGDNVGAQSALHDIREFLAAHEEEADLTSHIVSWKKHANDIIDAALRKGASESRIRVGTPDDTAVGKPGHERLLVWRVSSAEAEVGGQTLALDLKTVEAGIGHLLSQIEEQVAGEQPEVTIRIVISSKN